MSAPTPNPFASIFGDLFGGPKPTPAQQSCSHLLSAKMPDGKFFCPSCRLVSSVPLVRS